MLHHSSKSHISLIMYLWFYLLFIYLHTYVRSCHDWAFFGFSGSQLHVYIQLWKLLVYKCVWDGQSLHVHIHRYTYILYCPKLWLKGLFLSSNFSSLPLNETGDYIRPAFINWSSESKFIRWWILMAAGNTHVVQCRSSRYCAPWNGQHGS